MKLILKKIVVSGIISLCVATMLVPVGGNVHASESNVVAEGEALSFDRRKGNCLACHYIVGAEAPGNIGPALVAMKARYPDKVELRKRIWDMTEFLPEATMPPFGKHRILTEEEIDKITEYISTL